MFKGIEYVYGQGQVFVFSRIGKHSSRGIVGVRVRIAMGLAWENLNRLAGGRFIKSIKCLIFIEIVCWRPNRASTQEKMALSRRVKTSSSSPTPTLTFCARLEVVKKTMRRRRRKRSGSFHLFGLSACVAYMVPALYLFFLSLPFLFLFS